MEAEELNVFYNGSPVGKVRRYPDNKYEFEYSSSFSGIISLRLPRTKDLHEGLEVRNFLDNLIPDDKRVRQKIADVFAGEIRYSDVFDLLKAIGRDCVGALQFLPPNKNNFEDLNEIKAEVVSENDIAKKINKITSDNDSTPLGLDEDFRMSLAGMNEKTAYLKHGGKWQRPKGTTPSTHIFKPSMTDSKIKDSSANEYFCMNLADEMGLIVPETNLKKYDDTFVLVVRRFDRTQEYERVHQEDMCQALGYPSSKKYEDPKHHEPKSPGGKAGPTMMECLELLDNGQEPISDHRRFLSAQIFFWVIGATDGHAKNYSIQYEEAKEEGYSLAPFYDIVSKQPYVDRKKNQRLRSRGRGHSGGNIAKIPQLELAFSVGEGQNYQERKFKISKIGPNDFYSMSSSEKRSRLTEADIKSIFENVHDKIDEALEKTSNKMPDFFPDRIEDSIRSFAKDQKERISMILN